MELAIAPALEPKLVLSARRRRLRLGNLMVAVALVALRVSTVTVVEPASDKRIMGIFTFAFLGLLVGQRGLARISCRRFRPAIDAMLGVLSCVITCSMFVSLVILGLTNLNCRE
jgi:hypothetical protein